MLYYNDNIHCQKFPSNVELLSGSKSANVIKYVSISISKFGESWILVQTYTILSQNIVANHMWSANKSAEYV